MLGRNDMCHCGSGKKYKKCCMEKDLIEKRNHMSADNAEQQKQAAQDKYIKVYRDIYEFSDDERFKDDYEKAKELFYIIDNDKMHEKFGQFFITYFIFDHISEDGTVMAVKYAKENESKLSELSKSIIGSVLNTSMSVFEVVEKNPDSVVIRNCITDRVYDTVEVKLLEKINVGEFFIGRVANIAGVNLLIDITVSIPEGTKEFIVKDIERLFNQYKDVYNNIEVFLIYHTYVFYRYIQQLLDREVAEYTASVKANSEKEIHKPSKEVMEAKTAVDKSSLEVSLQMLDENGEESLKEDYKTLVEKLIASEHKFTAQSSTLAAVIDYFLRKENKISATQKNIAQIYSISASTLSKNFNEYKEVLVESYK